MHEANYSGSRSPCRPIRLLLLISATLALLTACGGGDDDATEASAAYMMDEAADSAMASEYEPADMEEGRSSRPSAESADVSASEEAATASLAVPTVLTPADLGRQIVYRATISVQADDVTAASKEAVTVVQALGGIVFSQTTSIEPEPRTEIVFKVLPADFSTTLERLAGVGRLVDQSISADDVTERVVDLESRIKTAETSVSRLQRLLEEAADLEDVAQIERQLLDRETTLEVLRGQMRILRDQLDLATVTLTITQSPTVLPDSGIMVQAWVSDDADDPCLGTEYYSTDPDSVLYFCLEVENTGASTLTDVTVRSREVRLDVGSFELVQGGFDRIEPGELLVAVLAEPVEDGRVAGRVATRGLEINLEVEAVPVDSTGELLQEVSSSAWVYLDVDPDESLPGLRDSISDGTGFLRSLGGVALVAIGFLIPFLPFVAVIVALVWWRWRRRGRARSGRKQATTTTTSPGAEPATGSPQEHT